MADNLLGHFADFSWVEWWKSGDICHGLPHNPPIFIIWRSSILVDIGLN